MLLPPREPTYEGFAMFLSFALSYVLTRPLSLSEILFALPFIGSAPYLATMILNPNLDWGSEAPVWAYLIWLIVALALIISSEISSRKHLATLLRALLYILAGGLIYALAERFSYISTSQQTFVVGILGVLDSPLSLIAVCAVGLSRSSKSDRFIQGVNQVQPARRWSIMSMLTNGIDNMRLERVPKPCHALFVPPLAAWQLGFRPLAYHSAAVCAASVIGSISYSPLCLLAWPAAGGVVLILRRAAIYMLVFL